MPPANPVLPQPMKFKFKPKQITTYKERLIMVQLRYGGLGLYQNTYMKINEIARLRGCKYSTCCGILRRYAEAGG